MFEKRDKWVVKKYFKMDDHLGLSWNLSPNIVQLCFF